MATDHILITYARTRAERRPLADRIRTWVWRHHEDLLACTASGALGLILSSAAIYSIIINY